MRNLTTNELLDIITSETGHTIQELGTDTRNELKETIEAFNDDWYDTIEIEGEEYKIISESIIDEIHIESLIEMIKDCYDLDNLPNFIEIDWTASAENCAVAWYAHHFATYDGEEHESQGVYLFRIN